jgi:chromosome segregation ATPase
MTELNAEKITRLENALADTETHVDNLVRQREAVVHQLNVRDRRLADVLAERQGYRDQNRQLVASLEEARKEFADERRHSVILLQSLESLRQQHEIDEQRIIEAQQKIVELVTNMEPESLILREKSARTRAIEAAAAAELAAEAADLKGAHAFSVVSYAWARIAGLPEKRNNTSD